MLWRMLIAFLTWLSADPTALDTEHPRAAAAVAAAYASMNNEVVPEPAPPNKCVCGGTCKNGVWKPDGRIEQPCPCPKTCACKSGKCPDGKCRQ